MVSETHLIQLIFKYKYVENIREIGKGYKDKLFLSGQWRSACEKDEMTSFQVIPLSMSILIFFLFFFSWLFVCLTGFLICFVFFKMPVKINEKGWLKRLALFFFEDYFLPEKKEPQPLWWLLVQHLPQQFCSCPLTAVSSAYLRVLHVRMQTNKSLFNRGSSHTCTVRSSQYHLFNWSCRKTHQFRSDLITQCKAHLLPDTAMARSGFPLLDFAKVVESIAWATARRLLRLNSFKGADLLLF